LGVIISSPVRHLKIRESKGDPFDKEAAAASFSFL